MAIASLSLSQRLSRPAGANPGLNRRLAYLSGGFRVSTRADAEEGGPRAHVQGVISGFRDLGWQVENFIIGDRVPARMTRRSHHLVQNHWWRSLASDVGRLALRPICARQAWRELGNRFEWVYERLATFQCLGRRFQRSGAAWILETNGLLFREAKFDRHCLVLSPIARRLELEAYRRADAVVCVSRTLKSLVCDEAGIPAEKVLVVPNGVDTTFLDPQKQAAQRLFEGLTVGYVGRLVEWQALDLLFRAVHDLKRERGIHINVVVMGDGRMRQPWMNLVRDMGLSTQIQFLGQVSSDLVPAYLAGVDIGYSGQVPLKTAAMYHSPVKIYEYMAMGRPVLASAFDDAVNVLTKRRTGFLFQPEDKQDLKRALIEVYAARESLAEMGRLGRQEVILHHSWKSRVETMAAGVQQILNRRSR